MYKGYHFVKRPGTSRYLYEAKVRPGGSGSTPSASFFSSSCAGGSDARRDPKRVVKSSSFTCSFLLPAFSIQPIRPVQYGLRFALAPTHDWSSCWSACRCCSTSPEMSCVTRCTFERSRPESCRTSRSPRCAVSYGLSALYLGIY